jgi:subtilisin family serine protease
MAKVIGKKELCKTDLKYFNAKQGIEGKTLFDRYSSLENIVKNNIDSTYQDFLAYPVSDENSITFHGKSYNETPRILSDLHGEEKERYENIKSDTLSHYNHKIDSLKKSGKNIESEFIDDAIKFIDDRFVYCYDNKVVLGVWGMQLKDYYREDISVIRKNLATKIKTNPPPDPEPVITGDSSGPNIAIPLTEEEPPYIPELPEEPPYIPPVPPKLPWYKRFWNWLLLLFTGRGCLRWLLWLLLFLLLLCLLSWLFRSCDRHAVGGAALGNNDSTWVRDDPSVGKDGGIYDPHNPYQPIPTPPEHEGILPPQQGVLPPIGDSPDIIPGNPTILANRLNILMENEDKSIMDLAKDFKRKYPGEAYKVVYYDDVVKRMQIEIPKGERIRLKDEIPPAFAPEYDLFVFDEALFEGNYIPNDPAFSDESKSWYLKAIKAPEAWDISRGSEKITIAIVDNGFNLKHPELASKVISPYNVWKHSNDISPQQVDHGTHVAGIALAIADNGKGISGIASGCKFMPIQVANEQGMMTTTSVLDGILYSLYQGADVVNVSLGAQFTGLSQYPENVQKDMIRNHFKEEERLWRRIMRIAADHNSTIVIAAGNDNVLAGIDAIQRPELFITVSATDKNNQSKAQFSNFGSYSTVSAPGVGIYSTIGKNDYTTMDGTSMAAPIVAGAVALMKSINDTITTKQIICILQSTGLETKGHIGKLIQLDKALQMVKSGATADCTPKPSSGDVQVLLSWNNYNDLDLICTDPNGEEVFFRNPNVSSGGRLEIDMNVEYPDSKTPIENIFWESGSAPQGTYNVYLLYYQKHEANINETPYNIQVKYGGKTENYSGVIKETDKTLHVCSFTLGTAGNSSQNNNPPPVNNNRSALEQQRDQLQQELNRVNNELRRIENTR